MALLQSEYLPRQQDLPLYTQKRMSVSPSQINGVQPVCIIALITDATSQLFASNTGLYLRRILCFQAFPSAYHHKLFCNICLLLPLAQASVEGCKYFERFNSRG
jgi:hypothetical protein